ncbi:MAG: hypothetical protein AAF843_14450 [Bacteroidota bacterium]
MKISLSRTLSFLCLVLTFSNLSILQSCSNDDGQLLPDLVANAGVDQSVCAGESVTIGGNPSADGGDGNYSYSWSNGAGTISNPEITPQETTTYTLTVEDNSGNTATDEVIVAVADTFFVNAGPDTTICAGSIYTLGGSPTVSGSSTYTYSWNDGTREVATEANPSLTVTSNTTFTLTVTDEFGCSETDDVKISMSSDFSVNAGDDLIFCTGELITLGGNPTVNGSGTYRFSWDNGAGITANPQVVPTATTTYRVTVTDENGCFKTDEVIVTLSPDFTVDSGNTEQICPGESIQLGGNPTADGPGTYSYSWSDGISEISTDANPTVSPSSATVYTVTVTNENGCVKSGSTEIGVSSIPSGSQVFTFTGGPQTFTFPECINELEIEIHGAEGQDGQDKNNLGVNGRGGKGALVMGTIQFDPSKGNMIIINIGGSGSNGGYNGGGEGGSSTNNAGGNGGGATDIRYGGSLLADRIVVAAGGGGGGGSTIGSSTFSAGNGSSAGGSNLNGSNSSGFPNSDFESGGGFGGTLTSGGFGGSEASNGGCQPGFSGINGQLSIGGAGAKGGNNPPNCTIQGAGGGGAGAGYYGGGGGASGQGNGSGISFPAGGGGAGSSYTGGIMNASEAESTRSGDGYVVIRWGN